ncbi:Tyrosine-protein kinase Wzc [Lunatimonas lonarensis]|uniref:Tyrosine-protein kinase Wzc n=1 Tax=Lunatimonas lonarensis TaxID=1232681 RepID=R7ZNC4_9BACT|nr:tyrosine-protein kinase family protein [Lunatimonas lonarensis]EON75601.1 Tyrosine-protein kinase Wzc [Lunatimonas lonarensis]
MKRSDILSDLLMDGTGEERSKPMDFKKIIFQYLRYWWLFLVSLVLFGCIAYVYIFFSTPLYNVSSTIMIKVDKNSDFTQNIVFSELEGFETTKQVENEIEVLGSFSLMRDAIEELPLETTFYLEDSYSRRREIYGWQVPVTVSIFHVNSVIYEEPDDWAVYLKLEDDGLLFLEGDNYNRYSYGDTLQNWYGSFSINKNEYFTNYSPKEMLFFFNNKDNLAGIYSSRLRVSLSSKFASVLILSLLDAVPDKGKDIINKLIEVYNKQAVREKNTTAENTIAFIDNQLVTLIDELKEVEREIEVYKRENNISGLGIEYNSFVENSKSYESELSRNRIQMEVLASIENYLDNPQSEGVEVPSTLSIADATLSALISKFNQLQSDKARISRTVQPSSPIMMGIEDELASLKRNIKANINNIKNSLEIENRNLSQNIRQIDGRISRVPEIERGLLELQRTQSRKQEQFLYLQAKREESELSLAATTVANARVIDKASAGNSPSKPNKPLFYGIALILGFGLPFGFVYLKSNLGNKIVQKSDISEILNKPILGEISHSSEKEFLVITKNRRSPIAEQFRLVRSNLTFMNEDEPSKVVMVTSSIPGEGKTFFSFNLAVSLSLTGKKAVVLEFDLRKPALFHNLGMPVGLGISDFVNDEALEPNDIIQSFDAIEGLKLVSCGEIPENPSEMILSERVERLFGFLRDNFDYVIVDTAPVGTVSDALSLARFVDTTLFIVRYNVTDKANLEFFREMEFHKKLRNMYIVANDAKVGLGHYGYAYGYGYDAEKPNKSKKSYSKT